MQLGRVIFPNLGWWERGMVRKIDFVHPYLAIVDSDFSLDPQAVLFWVFVAEQLVDEVLIVRS